MPVIRALLTTAVLAFASSVAAADTITVCLDGSCDYSDIQEAINAASDGDVIEIAAGTYYPAATIDTLGKAVTLRGEVDKDGAPTTVIDGQDSIRVLICESGEGPGTVFENLLITGGLAEGFYPDNIGGGMYNYISSPTLTNCVFTDNSATGTYGFGGGIFNEIKSSPTLTDCTFTGNSAELGGGIFNDHSSPTLENCTFTNNSAANDGGGMYNGGSSSPTLTNCSFEGNSADHGGGLHSNGSLTLENCTFANNTAAVDGGGIHCSPSSILTDTILCGNTPNNIDGSWTDNGGNCLSFSCADEDGDGVPDKCGRKGGAILLVPSEYPTIESAIAAAAYGDVIEISAGTYQPTETLNTQGKPITLRGAIDEDGQPITIIDGQDSIQVLQCTSGEGADTLFENLYITGGDTGGNAPYYGGGMYNASSSPRLENCTFSGNSASGTYGRGGGMINRYGSSPTLGNCTFEGNSADYGGGMYNESNSNPALSNCRFMDNSAGNGGGIYNSGSTPLLAYTVVCRNSASQIYGDWEDVGGNCITSICYDSNRDGSPDCEANETDDYLEVPSEYATIEVALLVATEGAVIDVAAGTYAPVVTLDTLGKNLILRGAVDEQGLPTTVIDGQGSIRVLQCTSGEGADTIFENLIITGGNAVSGGGMYNDNGSGPTLINCRFSDNVSTGEEWGSGGGGMYNSGGEQTLINCIFDGNTAVGFGGGIYNNLGSSTLENCTFTANASDSRGGGIYNDEGVQSLSTCVFEGNTAENGGGMYNDYKSNQVFVGCRFMGNSAGSGGGMHNYGCVQTLNSCEFENNISTGSGNVGGGAVYNYGVIQTMTTCLFEGNSASRGGAIWGAGLDLEYCTFRSNSASQGGGIYLQYGGKIASCIFEENYSGAGGGGAIYNVSTGNLLLQDCIFTNNWTYFSSGAGVLNSGCFSCEGKLVATGCAFIGNVAANHGGALYGHDYSSISLVDCVFTSNSDVDSYAVYNYLSSSTLSNCEFDRCCAVFPITSAIDMGGNQTLYICDGCEGDVTCDGIVDAADLGRLLAAWGPSTGRYDLNADGEVSGADLGLLIGTWGVCP